MRLPDGLTGRITIGLLVAAVAGSATGHTLAVYAAGRSVAGNTLTVAATLCSSPGSATLAPVADSYVDQSQPDTTFGGLTTLSVQSFKSRSRRTLVQFGLPAVPAGCSVTTATLQLFASSAPTGRSYLAYRLAAAWTEASVTWTTQPATAGSGVATPSGTGWISWAVTSQVLAMFAGSNYGFVVEDAAEGANSSATSTYSSRTGTNPPRLVIAWG